MRRDPTDRAHRGRGVLALLLVVGGALALLAALAAPADRPAGRTGPPTATPSSPAPPPPVLTGPPLLVGAAMHDNGDPAPLEREAGARLGVRRTFWDSTRLEASVAVAAQDVRLGRVPLLSYKVGDWTAAADGALDAWARAAADRLEALDGPVLVAVHHEPEGDGDITEWTRMQQRLAPLFDRPGVGYGVILTGYHQVFGDPGYALDALWPEGAPVRFLGVDVYQPYGTVEEETGAVNTRWVDLGAVYFDEVAGFADSRGVAWGVAETGLTDRAYDEHPAGRTWFADTARAVAERGGSFLAYFNSAQNSGQNTWPLDGPKRGGFVGLLADPPATVADAPALTRP